MKSASTLFLKTAVFVLSLPMVLFCLFLIPEVGRATADLLPAFGVSKYVVWALLYASVIIYFIISSQNTPPSRNVVRREEMNANPMILPVLIC